LKENDVPSEATTPARVKLPLRQVLQILGPYLRQRVMEQIRSVWLIVLYLVVFQTLLLGLPIFGAAVIAIGVVLVVIGLTFFMEGLMLGLMPLGELIGIKLPQKSKLPTILLFAFVLGVGATFAEPAVGVLKVAGSSVKAWDAPLLYLMLNRHADALVYAIAVGVGVAVVFGMLRFLYGWSLKPFIYTLVPLLLGLSAWSAFEPNMRAITGLAWDSGGVTTGPVTVPLVLALGIGICRVVARDGDSAGGGFGVVTLASLFPVLAVLLLGLGLLSSVPRPMSEAEFLAAPQRERVTQLFGSHEQLAGYVLQHAGPQGQLAFFGGDREALASALRQRAASPNPQLAAPAEPMHLGKLAARNAVAALQAIIPLTLLFFGVLWLLLRERVQRLDELLLGIVFALVGMAVFSMGIELGLSRLGSQVGAKLPSAFMAIPLDDERKVIRNFDPERVYTALAEDGSEQRFFYLKQGSDFVALPYDAAHFDAGTRQYTFTPQTGPLLGEARRLAGIVVVLLFAFVMGYGATLAEPALNALGRTVEELTVGTFRKPLLMHAVALGVGLGMFFGVAKIVWGIALVWLLLPPYALLLWLTYFCDEDFVNIGWDSAGVTTGPITVPLVLAMGLGIGGQLGVVEGFGILAMASVYPVLTVLGLSLWLNRRRRSALQEGAAHG
jgi:hypothetical protein